MTGEEEVEGIRMDNFFNKLAGRGSSGVKVQAIRQWTCGASDDLLVSDVRRA